MARHFLTTIEWIDKIPSKKELKRINQLMHFLDWDCPKFTEIGVVEGYWRKPILDLQAILNLLHCYGYTCRGKWEESYYGFSYKSYSSFSNEDDAYHHGESVSQALSKNEWIYSEPLISRKIFGRYWFKDHLKMILRFSRRFAKYLK